MENQLTALESFLDIPFIRRIRRNHGLEHATIHLLSKKAKSRIVGRSDARGFWLYGNISTEQVKAHAEQALSRMRQGEHNLAIHPNCGTNLLTVALLGTVATLVALIGSDRDRFGKLQRIPFIVLGIIASTIFGQPIGMSMQKNITTLGNPGDMEIISIKTRQRGDIYAHRVETRSS